MGPLLLKIILFTSMWTNKTWLILIFEKWNFQVNGFPTLIIFSNGEKVAEYNGKRDIDDLKSFVNKHLEAGGDEKKEEQKKDEL